MQRLRKAGYTIRYAGGTPDGVMFEVSHPILGWAGRYHWQLADILKGKDRFFAKTP